VTPQLTLNLLRSLFVIFAGFVGTTIGEKIHDTHLTDAAGELAENIHDYRFLGTAAGVVFGLLIVLCDRLLKGISLRIFSSATLGLLLGLFFSRLLISSDVLHYTSEDTRWMVSLAVYTTFGYLGMMLAIRSNRDEFSLIIPYVRFRQTGVQDAPLLVDTNIIIDGRLADICSTGFISGSLVVPRFVVHELQRLADSAEPLKRERGRRGLDSLNQMRKSENLSVAIHDTLHDETSPVDARLVQLAKLLQARLLTNDSNLCKIAQLQGVSVLNFNELAAALKPSVVTGDELQITLAKEGRDAHQAVGYLPDGTMIVVNHARAQIGKVVHVTIAGTLQTSAGRLFFAELKTA
jgi:uncharacterized protein YacL